MVANKLQNFYKFLLFAVVKKLGTKDFLIPYIAGMDLRELHAPLLQGEWESPADPDTFSDEGQVPLETANDESDMEDIPNELDVAEDEEAQELRLNRSSSVGDSPSPPAGLGSFAGLSAGLLAAGMSALLH